MMPHNPFESIFYKAIDETAAAATATEQRINEIVLEIDAALGSASSGKLSAVSIPNGSEVIVRICSITDPGIGSDWLRIEIHASSMCVARIAFCESEDVVIECRNDDDIRDAILEAAMREETVSIVKREYAR